MTNIIATSYCACVLCCGHKATGITAIVRPPVEGITIAAPRSIPLGTLVRLELPALRWTNVFRVEDRTARRYDGRWDVYIEDHQKARRFGLQRGNVTIIK